MEPIRVLVVDDSVVIRRLVTGILEQDPEIEVVGTAINGRVGLTKIEQLHPDIVTMDIEMPECDGIEAVRRLRASGNQVPVIMFSTLTERGAVATLDALAAGASDYVPKPANVGSVSRSMEQVREALIPRIKALASRRQQRPGGPGGPGGAISPAGVAPRAVPATARSGAAKAAPTLRPAITPAAGYQLLVIGSSTGGPEALTRLLCALPVLPVPIAIVQHMPALFTRQLAARLDRQVTSTVTEAADGQLLLPGTVCIAPGDQHLQLIRTARGTVTRLHQGPPENYCRPAVDVLFRSAVDAAGSGVLAAVLTGMGSDGALGSRVIVDAGGSVLAQDEATSVVWGMPGAVATAGLAEAILPLPSLAAEITRRFAGRAVRHDRAQHAPAH